MTCLFGRIQVELNSGSSISHLFVARGLYVKYPRSLALCIRRTLDLSVKIHVKKCVLYTRNYGTCCFFHLRCIHTYIHKYLSWIKEWICSERPITINAIVKGWTCQGSLIWHKRDVTMGQGPIRALVSFTLQHTQNTTFELFVEASLFRLTGWFHIHLLFFFI